MHWEMFTYAIFKGGLIKHSSHSDNHQSQSVTMLICEVMTLIVSVSLVNNSLIFPHFETCATRNVINDKCQGKHHLLLNIQVNSIKFFVFPKKGKSTIFFRFFFLLNLLLLPNNCLEYNDHMILVNQWTSTEFIFPPNKNNLSRYLLMSCTTNNTVSSEQVIKFEKLKKIFNESLT